MARSLVALLAVTALLLKADHNAPSGGPNPVKRAFASIVVVDCPPRGWCEVAL